MLRCACISASVSMSLRRLSQLGLQPSIHAARSALASSTLLPILSGGSGRAASGLIHSDKCQTEGAGLPCALHVCCLPASPFLGLPAPPPVWGRAHEREAHEQPHHLRSLSTEVVTNVTAARHPSPCSWDHPSREQLPDGCIHNTVPSAHPSLSFSIPGSFRTASLPDITARRTSSTAHVTVSVRGIASRSTPLLQRFESRAVAGATGRGHSSDRCIGYNRHGLASRSVANGGTGCPLGSARGFAAEAALDPATYQIEIMTGVKLWTLSAFA